MITELFVEHPRSVGQTYLEHMGVALRFSRGCLQAAGFAAVHAVFPFLYTTRAGDKVRELHRVLDGLAAAARRN